MVNGLDTKLAEVSSRARVQNELYQGLVLLADGSLVNIPAAERLRILRSKLERLNLSERKYQIIAISSAVPQEGKSFVSVNLSRALSIDPSKKNLIIDCDLRRPSVHKFFDLPRTPGLSDFLSGAMPLEKVLRPVATGLSVITAGSPVEDPLQILEQEHMARTLDYLRNDFQYIIIDCPPVLLCPEPISLSLLADSTLMVVRAWRTGRRLVKDAVEAIGTSRILGVVVNDCSDAAKEYLEYGYYGYSGATAKRSESVG